MQGTSLRILIDQIQSLENKIKEIGEKIDEILSFHESSSPQKRLFSVSGAGPKTVGAFLGEVDDIGRFSSPTKLIGFMGWHPKNIRIRREQKLSAQDVQKGPFCLKSLIVHGYGSLLKTQSLSSVPLP